MFTRNSQVLITLITCFVSLTRAQSSYQQWFCRTLGTELTSCYLRCADGLARPNGCEICSCRKSLCMDKSKVKCPEGWHCEVEQSGSAWFPIDVPACVKDVVSPLAASNEEATTTTSTTSTISTITTTTTFTTTATPQLLPIKTTRETAIVAQTCEQRGRCDDTRICDHADYVCRSDGRCCRPDNLRPEPLADIPRCQQKPSIGMCRAYTVQYIYDISIGRCTDTIFGGCGQSGNSFVTLEECKDICEKPCQQPQSDGPCRANIPRFYFDFDENRCLLFDYGGCQGNSNNFATAEECDIQCSGVNKTGVSVYSFKYRNNAKTLMTYSENQNKGEANDQINSDTANSQQNDTSNGTTFKALSSNDGSTKDSDTKHNGKETTMASMPTIDSNDTSLDRYPINSIIEKYKDSKPIRNPNSLAFSTNNDRKDSQNGTSTEHEPDNIDNEDNRNEDDSDKDGPDNQSRKLPDFLKFLLGRG